MANRLPARIYFSEERNNFVVVLSHFLPWKVRKFDCVPGDMMIGRSSYFDYLYVEYLLNIIFAQKLMLDNYLFSVLEEPRDI